MNGKLIIAEKLSLTNANRLTKALEERLSKICSGLDASMKVEGFASNGFPKITVTGTDSEICYEMIKKEYGLAPEEVSEIEVNDNFKAYITGIDAKRQSINVEIGPVSARFRSEIVMEGLRAQLCDGREVPVDRIARTYCLHEGIPVFVRITCVDLDRRYMEAWLSDNQTDQFEEWRRERFQRIIAVGGFQDKLGEAARISRLERDIIGAEQLSLIVHCIVCKLGTDAPGIIAKIGRHVGEFRLHAFLPEKIDKLRAGTPETA